MFESVMGAIEAVKDLNDLTKYKERKECNAMDASFRLFDARNALRVATKAAQKSVQHLRRVAGGKALQDAMDRAVEVAIALEEATDAAYAKTERNCAKVCTDFLAGEQRMKIACSLAGVTPEQAYRFYLEQLGDTEAAVAESIAIEDAVPPQKRFRA
jgi:hypothetical protein